MRFAAHVTDGGVLQVYDEAKWHQALDKRSGKRVWVELLSEAQIRSNQQNRRWWGLIVPAVQECWQRDRGDTLPLPKEAVHDALVAAFGGGMVKTPLGRARRSTTSMSTEEFTALMEAVEEYALHKYQMVIPDEEPA